MKRYCCGFMFSDDKSIVVLIKKNRPEWQKGLLNGVGGKIEYDESSVQAMVREFYEETGVLTTNDNWSHVLTLRFPYAEVEIFAGSADEYVSHVESTTDEFIYLQDVNNLVGTIDNIPALVELSLQRLIDRESISPKALFHKVESNGL